MSKYCVVSLIFNNYEILREVNKKSDNCDYLLFTDNKQLTSETWTVHYLQEFDTEELTGIQKTYKFKYSLFNYIPNVEQYSYIIRLDHSINIYEPLDYIIGYLDKNNYDILCSIHPHRTNFSEEYDCWIDSRNLDPIYKEKFLNYCNVDDIGLVECTAMVYKNSDNVINFLNDVYNVLKENNDFKDANDQCYFTYCLYKHKDELNILFTNAHLYRNTPLNSRLLSLCWHNTNIKVTENFIDIQTNIFNEKQSIKLF